jgi:hypothetical protein
MPAICSAGTLVPWKQMSIFAPNGTAPTSVHFTLKDIKAMSDPTYAIPTNMTGDMGEALLQKLTTDQRS